MFPRFTPLLAIPALLLSACGTYNGGVESAYQPVVQRQDYVFDVQTAGYGLAQGEPQRLEGWLADHARAGGMILMTTHHRFPEGFPVERLELDRFRSRESV